MHTIRINFMIIKIKRKKIILIPIHNHYHKTHPFLRRI
jgi:hypothetical protein